MNSFKLRRWAILTTLLYGLTFCALTVPAVVAAFAFGKDDVDEWSDFRYLVDVYGEWPYWASVGVLMFLQSLFLLAPIEAARERPVRRARWTTLAAVAGLLMGLLAMGLFFAVHEMATHEPFEMKGPVFAPFGVEMDAPVLGWAGFLGVVAWLIWALVFWRYAWAGDGATAIRRVVDRVLAGSVAELLVAVPCHVYARDKNYCCAGFGTFAGLATGLAVMLFAFGPGVFFLFAARVKRLQGAAAPAPPKTPWGTHTRDVALWSAAAAAAGLAAVAYRIDAGGDAAECLMARSVLVVTAAAAVVHAALAVRRREPHRLWVAAAGACLAEIVVLSVWWWVRNG